MALQIQWLHHLGSSVLVCYPFVMAVTPLPLQLCTKGDVGCGKTGSIFVMRGGNWLWIPVFMVPTELLAIQHYEHLLGLLENLTRIIRQVSNRGYVSVVIGTHSLIAEKVEFSALRNEVRFDKAYQVVSRISSVPLCVFKGEERRAEEGARS
ncbi:DNA helicase [Salvia divinorum]|uniref:DNA helicase n=1 Tax=Salvia divinorum TaxID=28513 RepID=A0ABD1HCG1_SALDI